MLDAAQSYTTDDTPFRCAGTAAPPAIPSPCETYAGHGEDLIAESLLAARLTTAGRGLDSVFYLEIGAVHPIRPSNTYLLYRNHGATGLVLVTSAGTIGDFHRLRPHDTVLPLDSNPPINDLLARHAGQPIDLLSIDDPGTARDILSTLDLSRHRPPVIQCPSADPAEPTALLQENGYGLAACTPGALIFTDTIGFDTAAAYPAINSFDVFDTLIARRCVHPHLVFAALEAALGIDGFARLRQEAEHAVSHPAMTLDDIYAELGRRLGADANATAMLRQAEIDAELAQVIPINENLARVRHGDLLLSDMYLPAEVIRALLEKAGLDRRVGLVVSANGKQSGRIWPRIRTGFTIGRHLGDNPVADVTMPQRFNIATEHTRLHEPTQVERFFFNNGLRPIGELIRTARLRIVTPNPLARRLLWVQTQYNFPIILLASVALHRHAAATGAARLLFSSRDCFLWHELYRALFPDATGTEYFYTSRRVRVDPSPGYRAYARDRLSPDSLLIDICGTGWSSAMLMEALDLPGRALFFLHRIPPIAVYEQRRPTPGICRVHELIGPDREALQNGRLEICNYAPHGTVVGVRMTEGVPVPAFDVEDRSAAQLTLVDQQIDCFRTMTRDACANLPRGCIWLTNREITDVVGALYALLCLETCIPNAFAMSHNREDLQALSAMRFPPP